MLTSFIHIVEALKGHPWAPFAFVSIYGLSCLVFPMTLFSLAGGILFGFWGGLALNMVGSLSGSSLAFFIARRLGRRRVQSLFGERMRRFQSSMAENGVASVLMMRFLGFPPFQLANYLSGLSSLSFRSYLAGTFLGILPWNLLITYFSNTLWEILRTDGMRGLQGALARRSGPLTALALGVVAVIGIQIYVKMRGKKA